LKFKSLSIQQITQKGLREKNFEIINLNLEHQVKGFLLFSKLLTEILYEEIKIPSYHILHKIWNYNKQGIGTTGHSSTVWGDVFKKHGKY
jgi:hypothetical protein